MPVAGLFVFCFVRALIQFSVQRQVQRHGRDARQPAARSEGRSQVLELHVHQLGRLDLIENEVLFLFFGTGGEIRGQCHIRVSNALRRTALSLSQGRSVLLFGGVLVLIDFVS